MYWCLFFLFLTVKGVPLWGDSKARREGGKKKGGREARQRAPHPSLLLQTLIGKYLYSSNFQELVKLLSNNLTGKINTYEKLFHHPDAFPTKLSSKLCNIPALPKQAIIQISMSQCASNNRLITTQLNDFTYYSQRAWCHVQIPLIPPERIDSTLPCIWDNNLC